MSCTFRGKQGNPADPCWTLELVIEWSFPEFRKPIKVRLPLPLPLRCCHYRGYTHTVPEPFPIPALGRLGRNVLQDGRAEKKDSPLVPYHSEKYSANPDVPSGDIASPLLRALIIPSFRTAHTVRCCWLCVKSCDTMCNQCLAWF